VSLLEPRDCRGLYASARKFFLQPVGAALGAGEYQERTHVLAQHLFEQTPIKRCVFYEPQTTFLFPAFTLVLTFIVISSCLRFADRLGLRQ